LKHALLTYSLIRDNDTKQAADTGSAVHKAAASWHNSGQDVAEALRVMRAQLAEYPDADLADAEQQFRCYTRDPRNTKAEIVAVEQKVSFALDPAEEDPTGQPIVVNGTLDQIRRIDGTPYVWDIKTSNAERKSGWTLVQEYTMQLAAYSVGATKLLGVPVHPGGVIRTRAYTLKSSRKPENEPDGVFNWVEFGLRECSVLLDTVRLYVALVRRGNLWPVPGSHCSWCPCGGPGGSNGCLQKLKELCGG
jgi:hypothetical protein